MILREATPTDIPQLQIIRNSVRENVLSDPSLISSPDYQKYLTEYGKGWVCEIAGQVVGFSIVSLKHRNVWAMFVSPQFERQGIGKKLHDILLQWYFTQTSDTIWLSTAPESRAEAFYRMSGWKEAGVYGNGEIRFEMSIDDWQLMAPGKFK